MVSRVDFWGLGEGAAERHVGTLTLEEGRLVPRPDGPTLRGVLEERLVVPGDTRGPRVTAATPGEFLRLLPAHFRSPYFRAVAAHEGDGEQTPAPYARAGTPVVLPAVRDEPAAAPAGPPVVLNLTLNLPEQPAPTVHVSNAPPAVHVAAPVVHVAAPEIHPTFTANVTVERPQGKRAVSFSTDEYGNITGGEIGAPDAPGAAPDAPGAAPGKD